MGIFVEVGVFVRVEFLNFEVGVVAGEPCIGHLVINYIDTEHSTGIISDDFFYSILGLFEVGHSGGSGLDFAQPRLDFLNQKGEQLLRGSRRSF